MTYFVQIWCWKMEVLQVYDSRGPNQYKDAILPAYEFALKRWDHKTVFSL